MWIPLLAALAFGPRPLTEDPSQARVVRIEVVDIEGVAIEGASAAARAKDGKFKELSWAPSEAGQITIEVAESGPLTLVVRAPGHATAVVHHVARDDDVARVELAQADPVLLRLESASGEPIPAELRPSIVTEELLVDAWMGAQDLPWMEGDGFVLEMFPTRSVSDGAFEVDLPAEVEFWILIHSPGFLRAYQEGPFRRSELKDDALELLLPAPASLTATFEPAGGAASAPYERCGVQLGCIPEGVGWFFMLDTREIAGARLAETWSDLAPSEFSVEVFTGAQTDKYVRPHERFSEKEAVVLAEGTATQLSFQHTPLPEEELKGTYAVAIEVARFGGQPARGLPFLLTYSHPNYGSLQVRRGSLDPDGVAELSGLPGGERSLPFRLTIDSIRMGEVQLEGDQTSRRLQFRLPPNVGDVAPNISLFELATEDSVQLSDFEGQVLFLDFWATWCGPCQGPMSHSNEILSRRARDWAGKAAILGVSIDGTLEALRGHVESKGWHDVPHYWSHEGDVGWASAAARLYGIHSLPTGLLIDADGRIVWRGHPSSLDVEKDIDRLLAGK